MSRYLLAIAILAATASLGLTPAKAQSSLDEKCSKTPAPQLTIEDMQICESFYKFAAHMFSMNIALREKQAARDARNTQKSAGQ